MPLRDQNEQHPDRTLSPATPRARHLLGLLLLVLLPLLIVGFIAEDVFEKERFAFEQPFMIWLHEVAPHGLVQVSTLLHHVGGPAVMGTLFVLLPALLWLRGARNQALFSLFGLGGAVAVNAVMKVVFSRARPELWPRVVQENGASFPSGHTMFAAALVTVLVLLVWRTPYRRVALVVGVLYTALMGVSRLVLGVHFPTDVLCGALTGLAWVYGVHVVMGERRLPLVQPRLEADAKSPEHAPAR